MAIDAATPKPLTIYMIGLSLAPCAMLVAFMCSRGSAAIDIIVALSTLWMVAVGAMIVISPVPLATWIIGVAFAPAVIGGLALHLKGSRFHHVGEGSEARGVAAQGSARGG